MDLKLNLPVSIGIILAIIVAGTVPMFNFMLNETVLTMVVPSMIAFAAIVFLIGVKHGEYRAGAP